MEEANSPALNVVFMGSPGFASNILNKIAASPQIILSGVFTQPDRPAGRGRKIRESEVKIEARKLGLPVYQPSSLKTLDHIQPIIVLNPDVVVVAAYGLMLPKLLLDLPRLGCLNVHASLLPKLRGASPIQHAILTGETVTGVSIMRMDEGLDTGDVLLQRALGIDINDTAEDLHDQLSDLGAELLLQCIDQLERNEIIPFPQDDSRATYAPKLTKSDGLIDWRQPAQAVHNRIRAMHPWPGSFFYWNSPRHDDPLKLSLYPGHTGPEITSHQPGEIVGLMDQGLGIACADKYYILPAIKPEGAKQLSPEDFCNGYLKSN